jgi:hypothetical protein
MLLFSFFLAADSITLFDFYLNGASIHSFGAALLADGFGIRNDV